MLKASKKNILTGTIVLMLILLASGIQFLTLKNIIPRDALLIRSIIHIGLLIAWGISIHTRIIQVQVRRYLLSIIFLMITWLMLKTIKHAIANISLKHWLWYLYYIPILFIPIISFFISMSLGKSEGYRLPIWTKLFYVPSGILFCFVITNDMHELVFSFPAKVRIDIGYQHEIIYYIILLWVMLCALISFVIMLKKCRIPHSKRLFFLPLIPLVLTFAYAFFYIYDFEPVLLLAGDMAVTHCILIFCIFESYIQCGLIHSNTGYDKLLEATTIPIWITDEHLNTKHISAAIGEPLSKEALMHANSKSILLDDDTLLKSHNFKHGWVFWKEDISELNKIQKELKLTHDELSDTGNVLEEEAKLHEKLLHLTEENRLYDMMASQTAMQISMLQELLAKLKNLEDIELARQILGQIIIIGTYIKRRNNLIFVGSQNNTISTQELRLCLNESAENLNLNGIKCKVVVNGSKKLTSTQAMQLYDFFEAVVELNLNASYLLLVSIDTFAVPEINICISQTISPDRLKESFPDMLFETDEDGLSYLTLKTNDKGERTHE